jgi:two-component system, NtrC family, response regulator HydG
MRGPTLAVPLGPDLKAADLNLAELMEFANGRVSFHGRRLILHDLHALGQFRRDLIEMVGEEQAHRILTRKGFFWGQSDAAAMERLYRWDNKEEWIKAAAMLSRITGLSEAEMQLRHLDTDTGRIEVEAVWRNSSEVEQHLNEMGRSSYPICWVLVGYASGYVSFCLGRPVYFVETQCQAADGVCCLAVGKDAESWGVGFESHLSFFHAADIKQRVQDLTEELARKEKELERQKRELERKTRVAGSPWVEARSPAYQRTLELASRVAKFDTTVLITGETGSGKEVLARYLHRYSSRADRPMLAINCSALPENLLESELFGHRAGAFTGATQNHAGLFEAAGGGTVFLDEIGDVSPAMQVKLLRVLQEREVKRVGESQTRPVDVRVISATNQDLERLVAEGKFREDLFFRLHVVHIRVPALRDRRDDILPLARQFLKDIGRRLKLPALRLDPACVDVLTHHSWPGNVRELQNALEHAAVMCHGHVLTPDLLPLRDVAARAQPLTDPRTQSLHELELEHIRRVLESTQGNRTQAAKILGIGEATLYRKLRNLKGSNPEQGVSTTRS